MKVGRTKFSVTWNVIAAHGLNRKWKHTENLRRSPHCSIISGGVYIFGRGYKPSHEAPWGVRKPREVSQLVSTSKNSIELTKSWEPSRDTAWGVTGIMRCHEVSRGVSRFHDTSETPFSCALLSWGVTWTSVSCFTRVVIYLLCSVVSTTHEAEQAKFLKYLWASSRSQSLIKMWVTGRCVGVWLESRDRARPRLRRGGLTPTLTPTLTLTLTRPYLVELPYGYARVSGL